MRYKIEEEPEYNEFHVKEQEGFTRAVTTFVEDAEIIKTAFEMNDKIHDLASHKPVGDQVIVKQHKQDAMIGGIILPEKIREKLWCGTVVAIGPGKVQKDGTRKPLQVKVGDIVYFHWDNHRVEINMEEFLSMQESTILAVVD